jgi:CBS domain-containing protein
MGSLLARDIMTASVSTVAPGTPLRDLEATLTRLRISGVPVTDPSGDLIGVVSRADVVRGLTGAGSEAQAILAYYRDVAGAEPAPGAASQLTGERMDSLRVEDVMATDLLTVAADRPVAEVAKLLVERQVHRVLVTDGRRLLGLVSSLDVVRAVADGRLVVRGS